MKRWLPFMLSLFLLFIWGLGNPSGADQGVGPSTSPRLVWVPLEHRLAVLNEKGQPLTPAGVFGKSLGDTLPSWSEGESLQPKSPPKAFLLSAVVPGSGQLYAQARRGYLFLAVEALVVGGYFFFQHRGEHWKGEYTAFADQHWFEGRYRVWYNHWDSVYSGNLADSLTHHLPAQRDHDYYEMIGKYDQFVYGWDDVDSTGIASHPPGDLADVHSAHREEYLSLRDRCNRYLRWANYGLGVMLFNRVLSALDAARAARSYNQRADKKRVEVNLKFDLRPYGRGQIPEIVFWARF